MYLIIKNDFDNLENHNPYVENIVGYVEDENSAIQWINGIMEKIKQYKGYDGGTYPYYEKRHIEKLQ